MENRRLREEKRERELREIRQVDEALTERQKKIKLLVILLVVLLMFASYLVIAFGLKNTFSGEKYMDQGMSVLRDGMVAGSSSGILDSLPFFREAHKKDPDDAKPVLYQGIAYYYAYMADRERRRQEPVPADEEKLERSIAFLKEAGEMDPRLLQGYFFLAACYFERRDYDAAEREIDMMSGVAEESVRNPAVKIEITDLAIRTRAIISLHRGTDEKPLFPDYPMNSLLPPSGNGAQDPVQDAQKSEPENGDD